MVKIINFCGGLCVVTIASILIAISKKLTKQYNLIRNDIDAALQVNYKVDKELIFGVVLIEDKRFYFHKGVDFYAIARAIYNYFFCKRLEGASTIEQQLVRLITNKREISMLRKAKELVFATKISTLYNKEQIIVTYLNIYKFHGGIKGILELCHYEKCNLNYIDTKSICELSARIKHPNILQTNYLKYLKRVRKVEILLLKYNKAPIVHNI